MTVRLANSPRPPNRHEQGFSLIELMTSLVLMTILFGIGVPAMSRFRKTSDLLTSVSALEADLRLCRQRAVSEQNNVRFTWDLGNNKYQWHDDDDNDGTVDSGEFQSAWKQLPSGVDLQDGASAFGASTVVFSSNGSANLGGQLKLINAAGLTRRVQVIAASGLVKVIA